MSPLETLQQGAAPIDRVARRVTGKGVAWIPTACRSEPVFDVQPLIGEITKAMHNNGGFCDLTGRRIGLMTVVGISAERPARWVVRCDCALYVFRSAKAIKANASGYDACPRCVAKRRAQGIRPDDMPKRLARGIA